MSEMQEDIASGGAPSKTAALSAVATLALWLCSFPESLFAPNSDDKPNNLTMGEAGLGLPVADASRESVNICRTSVVAIFFLVAYLRYRSTGIGHEEQVWLWQ